MAENKSIYDAEPSRLRFDTENDAFNYADKLVEDCVNWVSAHDLNICKSYDEGQCEIVLDAFCISGGEHYYLVISAIQHDIRWHAREAADVLGARTVWNAYISTALCEGGTEKFDSSNSASNEFVFVGITNLVQSPKKIIPSAIWLESQYKIKDFIGKVVGTSFVFMTILNVKDSVTEREMSPISPPSSRNSDVVTSLIQGGPQIIDSVKCDAREGGWQGLGQLDFMNLLASLSVRLDETSVRVAFNELRDFLLKLSNPALCVRDAVL